MLPTSILNITLATDASKPFSKIFRINFPFFSKLNVSKILGLNFSIKMPTNLCTLKAMVYILWYLIDCLI